MGPIITPILWVRKLRQGSSQSGMSAGHPASSEIWWVSVEGVASLRMKTDRLSPNHSLPRQEGGEKNLATHFRLILLPKILISFPFVTTGFTKRQKERRNSAGQKIKKGKGRERETSRIIKRKEHSTQVYSGFGQEFTVGVPFSP